MVEAPGASAPFSIMPMLVKMEGGRIVGPIIPRPLTYHLEGQHTEGYSVSGRGGIWGRDPIGGSSTGGNKNKNSRMGLVGGGCEGGVAVQFAPDQPVLLRLGELADHPRLDVTTHSERPHYWQELAPVQGVMG